MHPLPVRVLVTLHDIISVISSNRLVHAYADLGHTVRGSAGNIPEMESQPGTCKEYDRYDCKCSPQVSVLFAKFANLGT